MSITSGAGRNLGVRHAGQWSRNAALSMANGATTTLSMNVETEDTDGYLTPTSGVITIPAGLGGLYLLNAGVSLAAVTASRGRMAFEFAAGTGTLPAGTPTALRTDMVGESDNSITSLVQLNAGNTVTLNVFHSTGSAINANTAFLSLLLVPQGGVGATGPTGLTGATGPTGLTTGAGAPAGTGTDGQTYYDTTNDRSYLSDGIGWVIMSEPVQSFTPVVTAGSGTFTTVGAVSLQYHRCDGYLDFYIDIAITTNGTGGGSVLFTLPVAVTSAVAGWMGSVREIASNGHLCTIGVSGSQGNIIKYDNSYPGGSGFRFAGMGRYRMTTRYS